MIGIFILGMLCIVIANFLVIQGKPSKMFLAMKIMLIGNFTLALYYTLVEQYPSVTLSIVMGSFTIYGLTTWKKLK